MMNYSRDLISSFENDVKAHNRYRRYQPLLVLLACFSALLATHFFAMGSITDIIFTDNSTLLVTVFTVALIVVLIVLLENRYPKWFQRVVLLSVLILALVVWKPMLFQIFPIELESQLMTTYDLGHHFRCWGIGFGISILMLTVCYLIQCRFLMAPTRATRISSIGIAGLASLMAQAMYCPYINSEHVGSAHFGQILIAAASTLLVENFLQKRWKKSALSSDKQ